MEAFVAMFASMNTLTAPSKQDFFLLKSQMLVLSSSGNKWFVGKLYLCGQQAQEPCQTFWFPAVLSRVKVMKQECLQKE
ncbi:unnamed protein product [Coffea canephora]|uniref:Uncharacterized protein n=1 Tax=Coffea canephora TaxID=49390 RepID=A0A068TS83_COFCA|nr:unnamed protein product [Coffea canephora]